MQKALDLVSNRKLRMGFGNVTKTLRPEGGKVSDELIAKTIDEKLPKIIASGLGG